MIDQIRANKLPSNMMSFAAKGALSVPPDENIEILVYLAKHNKIFGDLARMTLAGWDEKSSAAAAADPKTPREVLAYLVSPDNLRPKLLPALLENPSVQEGEIEKYAISAQGDAVAVMLQSTRVKASSLILQSLRSNPYVKGNDAAQVAQLLNSGASANAAAAFASMSPAPQPQNVSVKPEPAPVTAAATPSTDHPASPSEVVETADSEVPDSEGSETSDAEVAAYMAEHAAEIAAEANKPFQAVGGVLELLGADYFPVSEVVDVQATPAQVIAVASSGSAAAAAPAKVPAAPPTPADGKRASILQQINALDVKGRIQMALKGNKEARSILIRDGTKVVALSVLEAPKITDGEVEKFALQKNVLEAVLRQIPLKRRFMKNYVVVRNLVANPRTPLDLGLGLMKHLMVQDLKNISSNKEVSETVRKLALKMYKQKIEAANKK